MIENPGLQFERELWKTGIQWIGGIDEAGRGALAGPVAAAVVILPNDFAIQTTLRGVRDSKQMTPLQRARAAQIIKAHAVAWAVGFSTSDEIDSIGILPATRQAVMRAVQSLSLMPEYLLLDYIHWPTLQNPHRCIVKGDRQSLSIAAASVIAKTSRDALMCELDSTYPAYGFARHKGYGTLMHRTAIQKIGLSPVHRKSFHIR
jgi:ribonuclease HII